MTTMTHPVKSIEHVFSDSDLPTFHRYKQPTSQPPSSVDQAMVLSNIVDDSVQTYSVSPVASAQSSRLSSISATPPVQLDGTGDMAPPAKRRKLTPADRAAKEAEKAQKQAEKQVKDEERRQKKEIAAAQKRQKDSKKQEEEEKKQKRERAQSRIHGFFTKPQSFMTIPEACANGNEYGGITAPKSQEPSLGIGFEPLMPMLASAASDYARIFLPFAAPSNSTIAPINRFIWDEEATILASAKANTWLSDEKFTLSPQPLRRCLDLNPLELAPRGLDLEETKDIVRKIELYSSHIRLSDDDSSGCLYPAHLRDKLVMKYIFFSKDVRPPYIGTVSAIRARTETARLGRDPFRRAHDELDYDYDSEAEWEEPEEGEDLDSDNEEDADSEQDPADIEEFLDDRDVDEASHIKRNTLCSDMKPLSTGMCWENFTGDITSLLIDPSPNPRQFRMEFIGDTFDRPIDPFSTAYWSRHTVSHPMTASEQIRAASPKARQPLQVRPDFLTNNLTVPSTTKTSKLAKPHRQVRVLSGSDLETFKRHVEGSDLTKVGLLAVLKKQLPHVSNAALGDTLSSVAARLGAKEADKRWKVI